MKPNTINHISQFLSSPKIQETQLYDKITRIQETIHSRLSQVKKLRNLNYLCEHTNRIQNGSKKQNFNYQENKNNGLQQYLKLQQPQDILRYDQAINYYDKFWKLFLMNENTAWKVNQLYDNLLEISKATLQIQKMFMQRERLIKLSETLAKGNQKRMTRNKSISSIGSQQQSKVICPYQDCQKQYGSQISQNLHIKLKHNGGNKSQRQFYAQHLWLKRQNKNGQQVQPITLAPGYFQQYGMITGRISREQYDELRKQNKWVQGQVDKKVAKKIQSNNKSEIQKSVQNQKVNQG